MSLEVHGELLPVGGGDAIPLIRTTMTVGRRESCDICMRFPNVSGMHCEFSFRDGYWYVRDLNSTNGIKVNGARVQEKLVYPGDEIGIGKRGYKIQYNMPAGRHAAAELEEDILTQSLLEKAGLERPKRRDQSRRGQGFDPAAFLLDDED
jgi:predicted component of type VI protein secretion system